MKKVLLTICISSLLFALSCGGSSNNAVTNSKNAEVKKGVAPVADAEIAVIEMETPAYGTIKLELYSNIAPQMVARFKDLAKEGYYNGIAFHRINQSVIQAVLVNNKKYPSIAEDYKQTFKTLKALPVDLFLGAHGAYYGLDKKYPKLNSGLGNPFIDAAGYLAYVTDREQAFLKELERQKKAQ